MQEAVPIDQVAFPPPSMLPPDSTANVPLTDYYSSQMIVPVFPVLLNLILMDLSA